MLRQLRREWQRELSSYLSQDIILNAVISTPDIDTLDRIDIMEELRTGIIDVLVGVNLLREGLDLPRSVACCYPRC